jgi:hypothetical protein
VIRSTAQTGCFAHIRRGGNMRQICRYALLAALVGGLTGFLITPLDPALTRFNIGVRTLCSGATIQVTVRDANGFVVRTASAIVYGSKTDNTTNDPAIQFVRGIFAIA